MKTDGLINSASDEADDEDVRDDGDEATVPDEAAAPQPSQSGTDLLKAAEQKIESQLVPKTRSDYLKIVAAGMKAGLQGGPHSIVASLAKSKDPVHDAAVGAVNLVIGPLWHLSRGTMPIKAMVPAAATLMLKALDFAENAGLIQVNNATVVKGMKTTVNTLFQRSGITPQMLQTAAQKVHGMIQNPGSLEGIKRAAGVVKDPRGSTPTPMPDEEPAKEEAE